MWSTSVTRRRTPRSRGSPGSTPRRGVVTRESAIYVSPEPGPCSGPCTPGTTPVPVAIRFASLDGRSRLPRHLSGTESPCTVAPCCS